MRMFFTGLIIIINFIFQSTFLDSISIAGIQPNTGLITVVAIALIRGENEGIVVGFMTGLLQDCYFSTIIGINPLLYMFLGFLCGRLFKVFYSDATLIPVAITMISDFVYNTFFYFFRILLKGYTDYFNFLKTIIIPEIIYTALVCIILYRIIYILNEFLEQREYKHKFL